MRRPRGLRNLSRQAGQVPVLFAVAAVATFGFVGLLMDASNLYRSRRLSQNAVDAGALAGAQLLASGGTTNAQVLAAINTYASQNGVTLSQLEAYYGSSSGLLDAIASYKSSHAPPSNAVGVRVVGRKAVTMVFGFLLGQKQKTAGAEAMAAFGPANTVEAGGGIFPVAIEDDILTAVKVGDVLRIWDEEKVTDDKGKAYGGNRGWLNLDYVYAGNDHNSRTVSTNHSNAKLKEWAENGKTPPIILFAGPVGKMTGDFINGDPGVRASSIEAAGVRIGKRVLVPIYDTAYTKDQLAAQPGFPTPAIGWANTTYYHIVGFAEFIISDVKSTGNPKWIEGAFASASIVPGSSAAYSSGLFQSDESSKAVSLTDTFGSASTTTTTPAPVSGPGESVGGAGEGVPSDKDKDK